MYKGYKCVSKSVLVEVCKLKNQSLKYGAHVILTHTHTCNHFPQTWTYPHSTAAQQEWVSLQVISSRRPTPHLAIVRSMPIEVRRMPDAMKWLRFLHWWLCWEWQADLDHYTLCLTWNVQLPACTRVRVCACKKNYLSSVACVRVLACVRACVRVCVKKTIYQMLSCYCVFARAVRACVRACVRVRMRASECANASKMYLYHHPSPHRPIVKGHVPLVRYYLSNVSFLHAHDPTQFDRGRLPAQRYCCT